MKTVVREIASLVIGLIGIVLAGVGMNQVLDIGSCASGGPYVIARPCPEGSDALFWLMFAADSCPLTMIPFPTNKASGVNSDNFG